MIMNSGEAFEADLGAGVSCRMPLVLFGDAQGTLPGGYRVSWTGMKTVKRDGSRHHGVGVLPTVAAGRTIQGLAAGRDEVLERPLTLVRG